MKIGTVDLAIADHSLIFALSKGRIYKSQKIQDISEVLNGFAPMTFQLTFQLPWETVAQHDNPNVCWQIWSTHFLQFLDLRAPLRCMRVRGNSIPWMSSYNKNLMKQRVFSKSKLKYNAQNHWRKYKELRNKVISEIRKAKSI